MTFRSLLVLAIALLSAGAGKVAIAPPPPPVFILRAPVTPVQEPAPEPPAPAPADGWTQYAVVTPFTDPAIVALVECESEGMIAAQNPVSSASGRYQFISSTWEWVTGLPAPARAYPLWRQQEAFVKLWDGGRGASHWECA